MRACDNPFSTTRISRVRYRLSEEGWKDLYSRWQALDHRVALVGPHGSGKTTLLEDFEPRLCARGHSVKRLFLNEETPAFAPGFLSRFYGELQESDVILFDGAEQMSWFQWKRFLRGSRVARGLIITVHRQGRLPTLHHCRTTPGLFHGILRDLLGDRAEEERAHATDLYHRHDGNIRDALRAFYDRYAGQPAWTSLQ